jgi:type VI protein secretion system component Hcp
LSTTELYQYCVKGTPLPTAKIHVGRNEGGVYKALLTYEFTNCFIASVSTGGAGGVPQDTLSLKAETVKCAYAAMENDGKAGGNNVWGWNLKTDTEIQ